MSALIGIQNSGQTVFACDSRACQTYNGNKYIVADDAQKMYVVDNKQIIFISGYIDMLSRILSSYMQLPTEQHTPDNLKFIAETMYRLFGMRKGTINIEVSLYQYEDGDLYCYNITDRDEFGNELNSIGRLNPIRRFKMPSDGVFTIGLSGYDTTRIMRDIYQPNINVEDVLLSTYGHWSSERIGGTMTIYVLTPSGVVYHNSLQIKDSGEFKRLPKTVLKQDVHYTPKHGLIITQMDGKMRIVANAQTGIYFQKGDGSGNKMPDDSEDLDADPHWTDKPVYIGKDGSATFGGDIHARKLFLQEIGGQNIVTYINKSSNSYDNTFSDNSNINSSGETVTEPEAKISGNYLEGRGLKAYDGRGRIRVKINGNDGTLSMYDGYIQMLDSNGNALYIDPIDFIRWVIDGQDKFYYDSAKDCIVFEGDIRASNIYGSKFYNAAGRSYISVGGEQSPAMGDLTLYSTSSTGNRQEVFKIYDGGSYVDMYAWGNKFLDSGSGTTNMCGTWNYNNSQVATLANINNLQGQINAIKEAMATSPTTPTV